jgi:hypothetical protein
MILFSDQSPQHHIGDELKVKTKMNETKHISFMLPILTIILNDKIILLASMFGILINLHLNIYFQSLDLYINIYI